MKLSMYNIVQQYLANPNREYVLALLKNQQPNEQHLLEWLHINGVNNLMFIDSKVKWKWDKEYFYEMVAYLHNGGKNQIIKLER